VKNIKIICFDIIACVAVLLAAFLCIGCTHQLLGSPEDLDLRSRGVGVLSVSFLDKSGNARTALATDPEFSRYELLVSLNSDGSGSTAYSSASGFFQIELPDGTYYISAAGYTGDSPTARTWDPAEEDVKWTSVTITSGAATPATLTLNPYMDGYTYGTLQYSLNWDAVGQIPYRAELLVEQYNSNGDKWTPIPISLMNDSVSAAATRGTITILRRDTGLVQQNGYLRLPPGEYRLTMSVTMDGPNPPVVRADIAHIFSNLVTPAAFYYSSGDLTVTSTDTEAGIAFITKFNF